MVLNTDWTVGEPMMLADIGGKGVTVQVGSGGGGGRHTLALYPGSFSEE